MVDKHFVDLLKEYHSLDPSLIKPTQIPSSATISYLSPPTLENIGSLKAGVKIKKPIYYKKLLRNVIPVHIMKDFELEFDRCIEEFNSKQMVSFFSFGVQLSI